MSGHELASAWCQIDDLAPRELYLLLKMRVDIFVVEQQCAYPELDGLDIDAHHLRLLDNGRLAGSLRVLPPESDDVVRIGRVAVSPHYRGRQLGQRLMQEAIAFIAQRYSGHTVELGAQAHLQDFYGRLGFAPISDIYLEDGIPHIDMRLAAGVRALS